MVQHTLMIVIIAGCGVHKICKYITLLYRMFQSISILTRTFDDFSLKDFLFYATMLLFKNIMVSPKMNNNKKCKHLIIIYSNLAYYS